MGATRLSAKGIVRLSPFRIKYDPNLFDCVPIWPPFDEMSQREKFFDVVINRDCSVVGPIIYFNKPALRPFNFVFESLHGFGTVQISTRFARCRVSLRCAIS